MSQLAFLIFLNLLTLAFNAGVLVTVVRSHGKEISGLKGESSRHDREIGVIYGQHPKLVREVRA